MKEEIIFAAVFTVTLFYLIFVAPQSSLSVDVGKAAQSEVVYGEVHDFSDDPMRVTVVKGSAHDFSNSPMRVTP